MLVGLAGFGCTRQPATSSSGASADNAGGGAQATGSAPATSAVWVTDTPDPLKTPVIIASVRHGDAGLETITVANISSMVQDITRFSLFVPETGDHFNFGELTLAPGAFIKVYNGVGVADRNDGLAWLSQPVLSVPGDELQLLNQAGRVMWTYIYYSE